MDSAGGGGGDDDIEVFDDGDVEAVDCGVAADADGGGGAADVHMGRIGPQGSSLPPPF